MTPPEKLYFSGQQPGEDSLQTNRAFPGRLDQKVFIFDETEQDLIRQTVDAAEAALPSFITPARTIFLDGFRNPALTISRKLENDTPASFVTQADTEIERLFRDEWLRQHFPEHAVLGEEGGRSEQESLWEWKIDPIDGTRNYTQGNPDSSIVLALCYRGVPVFAVCDLPNSNEQFVARAGGGITLNGEPIPAAQTQDKPQVVHCAFRTEARRQTAVGQLEPFANTYTKTSMLVEVADVLRGNADIGVWIEAGEHEWPAATLLAKEAGFAIWEVGKIQDGFDLTTHGERSFAIARNEDLFQLAFDKVKLPRDN